MRSSFHATLLACAIACCACRTARDRAEDPRAAEAVPSGCALTPEQWRSRRDRLLPGLLQRADEIADLEDGLRLRFADRAGLLAELSAVVEEERACCTFLRFQITAEPGLGPVILDVTGPPGTREALRSFVE